MKITLFNVQLYGIKVANWLNNIAKRLLYDFIAENFMVVECTIFELSYENSSQ